MFFFSQFLTEREGDRENCYHHFESLTRLIWDLQLLFYWRFVYNIFWHSCTDIFSIFKKMVMILSPSSKHFQVFYVEIHVWQVKMSLFIFCKVYSTLTDCPQTQRILSQHCKDVNTIALFCPSVQYLFFPLDHF